MLIREVVNSNIAGVVSSKSDADTQRNLWVVIVRTPKHAITYPCLAAEANLTEDKQPPQGLVWRLKRTSTFFSKIFNEVLSNLLFPTHKLILVGSKSSNWKDH